MFVRVNRVIRYGEFYPRLCYSPFLTIAGKFTVIESYFIDFFYLVLNLQLLFIFNNAGKAFMFVYAICVLFFFSWYSPSSHQPIHIHISDETERNLINPS